MSLTEGTGVSSEGVTLQRVREGDVGAYGVLYERHLAAARRLARSLLADPSDADDVVAEVFAASFAAMRKGRGPYDDFRPYLLTAVRRECQRTWRRGGRQRPGGDQVTDLASARPSTRDEIDGAAEDAIVHEAFAALPARMREVLWATEVEDRSHAEIAARNGMTSAAVAQLALRARRLFGERYLDAHLSVPDAGPAVAPACTATRQVLAEVVRGTASAPQRRLADEHSAGCAACADATSRLRVVNGRLRSGHALALLPAIAASRPARVGLLARLFGWVAGALPVVTASSALVLVAIVAPETTRIADAAAAPVVTVAPEAIVGMAPAQHVDTSTPAAAAPTSPAPRASAPAATVDATTAPVIPASVPAAAAEPAPAPPPGVPVEVADPTGAIEQTANGLTLDDGIANLAQPVLDALPSTRVHVDVAATPPVGPVGPVGPITADVGIGGGTIDASAAAGPAQVDVSVGGAGGPQVALPSVPEVIGALPAPLPAAVGSLPVFGSLLNGGG